MDSSNPPHGVDRGGDGGNGASGIMELLLGSPSFIFTGSMLCIEVVMMLILSLPQAPGLTRRLTKLFAQNRLVWWFSWTFLPFVVLLSAILIQNIRTFTNAGEIGPITGTNTITITDLASMINVIVSAAALFSIFVLRRLYLLMREYVHTILLEEEKSRDIIHHFVPPSKTSRKLQLGLWRWLTSPKFFGLENIDPSKAPFMFVGNHTLYGIDMPLLVNEVYEKKGIYMRGLGDYIHFFIPGWRDLMWYYGAVAGTRENCSALLSSGQSILVYPGGAREVFKQRRDPKYSLMWKDRLGFAKLAIQYGVPVIPVSSVGTEEILEVIADVPLDWMLKAVGYEKNHGARMLTMPIPALPKPQRVYFKFGAPIDTKRYNGDHENLEFLKELRDECSNAIRQGVELLQQIQREDPERDLIPRMRNEIKDTIKDLDLSNQLHSVSRHLMRTSPRKSKHRKTSKTTTTGNEEGADHDKHDEEHENETANQAEPSASTDSMASEFSSTSSASTPTTTTTTMPPPPSHVEGTSETPAILSPDDGGDGDHKTQEQQQQTAPDSTPDS